MAKRFSKKGSKSNLKTYSQTVSQLNILHVIKKNTIYEALSQKALSQYVRKLKFKAPFATYCIQNSGPVGHVVSGGKGRKVSGEPSVAIHIIT